MEMMVPVVAIQYNIRLEKAEKYVAAEQYMRTIPNVLFVFCNKSVLSFIAQQPSFLKNTFFLLLQDSSKALTWEKRTRISLGLIKAIQHLHQFGIIHGNIKRWESYYMRPTVLYII